MSYFDCYFTHIVVLCMSSTVATSSSPVYPSHGPVLHNHDAEWFSGYTSAGPVFSH